MTKTLGWSKLHIENVFVLFTTISMAAPPAGGGAMHKIGKSVQTIRTFPAFSEQILRTENMWGDAAQLAVPHWQATIWRVKICLEWWKINQQLTSSRTRVEYKKTWDFFTRTNSNSAGILYWVPLIYSAFGLNTDICVLSPFLISCTVYHGL